MILWLITAIALGGTPAGQDSAIALTTARLNTTHPSLTLHFEQTGNAANCGERCAPYRIWLTFRGHPENGALEATDWRRVLDASCLELKSSAGASFMCAATRPIAGRDKGGSDYVLMRFRASSEQVAGLAQDAGVKVAIGGVEFQLGKESRKMLSAWLEQIAAR